jgi:hypothetical protein
MRLYLAILGMIVSWTLLALAFASPILLPIVLWFVVGRSMEDWQPLLVVGIVSGLAVDIGIAATMTQLSGARVTPTIFEPDLERLTSRQLKAAPSDEDNRDWR